MESNLIVIVDLVSGAANLIINISTLELSKKFRKGFCNIFLLKIPSSTFTKNTMLNGHLNTFADKPAHP